MDNRCAVACRATALSLLLSLAPNSATAADSYENAARQFQQSVNEYMMIHRYVERSAPPLELSADLQKIQDAIDARAAGISSARSEAKEGDIFTADLRSAIRTRIAKVVAERGYDVAAILEAIVNGAEENGDWEPPVVNGDFSGSTRCRSKPYSWMSCPLCPGSWSIGSSTATWF